MEFLGSQLRLARTFKAFSLEEVAEAVGKTRQYIHKLETGQAEPTEGLMQLLADKLTVLPSFFYLAPKAHLVEQDFHFRKLITTRSGLKQTAMAKAEIFSRLVSVLETELRFPKLNIPSFPDLVRNDDIDRAAEFCRNEWGLGLGPISNMTRLAENLGAIVTNFSSVTSEVDALSVTLHRPVIVRNEAKRSVCRQRFDIGHELGHFVLHEGRPTGDRITESQANRFASMLLVPNSMMFKLFPKLKSGRLDWQRISEFKLQWKISKAALLYRAHQLDLINEHQYKSGVITLKRTGEAIQEKEDYMIPLEEPELLINSLRLLNERKNISFELLAAEIGLKAEFLIEFVTESLLEEQQLPTNVISLKQRLRRNIN